MTEEQIIRKALQNLRKETDIEGNWVKGTNRELDGQLTLALNGDRLRFNIEIKTELRNHQLPRILDYKRRHQPFMVVAGRLFPKMREQLKQNNIPYLEANGNIYLKDPKHWVIIEINEPIEIEREVQNRAFTKTGLAVVFEFLLNPQLINRTYREIAAQANTAIGNVANIINGLKQDRFIVQVNNKLKITNTKRLIDKWAEAYEKNLKPLLKIDTYKFLDPKFQPQWKDLKLKPGTKWGGEPAAEILTDYLRPEILTLYTAEPIPELMKNYRLVPAPAGKIEIYKTFWKNRTPGNTVPAILVYADLINTGNPRCAETAQKIYEQELQGKFE